MAQRKYQAALQKNPYENTALANLAVIEAASGDAREAMKLLDRALTADPSQTAAGLDLAFLQCRLGQKSEALQTIDEVKRFNPDSPAVHEFLEFGRYGGQVCRVK